MKAVEIEMSTVVEQQLQQAVLLLHRQLNNALCTANPLPTDNRVLCRWCWQIGPPPKGHAGTSWDTVNHKPNCPWNAVTEFLKSLPNCGE